MKIYFGSVRSNEASEIFCREKIKILCIHRRKLVNDDYLTFDILTVGKYLNSMIPEHLNSVNKLCLILL